MLEVTGLKTTAINGEQVTTPPKKVAPDPKSLPQEIIITALPLEGETKEDDPNSQKWGSGEHRDIANLVFHYFLCDLEQTDKDLHTRLVAKLTPEHAQTKLYDPLRSDGENIDVTLYRFTVSDKLTLNAGEIVALAGDFIGVPDRPIAFGTSSEDQEERFEEAFNKIRKTDEYQLSMIDKLVVAINNEKESVHGCMHGGGWVVKLIKNASETIKYNRMMEPPEHLRKVLKGDSYSKLLLTNFDHFGEEAKQAYLAGHRKALSYTKKAAESARKNAGNESAKAQQEDLLVTALLMELFACHFLTDLFAAGHVRTPRKELVNFLTNANGVSQRTQSNDSSRTASTSSSSTSTVDLPANTGIHRTPDLRNVSSPNLFIAGLFANRMHDEDGTRGIWVKTTREGNDNKWFAKGDGNYYIQDNQDNAKNACETMLIGLNDILLRFKRKHKMLNTLDKLNSYVPHAISTRDDKKQPLPMFFVRPETNEVVYRGNILETIKNEGWEKGVQSAMLCAPQNFGFLMTRMFNVAVVPAAHAAKEASQKAVEQKAEQVQALYEECQKQGVGCPIQ